MSERNFRARPVTKAQIIGILALTLALFLIVSFAARSVDLYRMRAWRTQLQGEIAALQREKLSLEFELRRRGSAAWVDQALRSMGRVPAGTLLVTPSQASQAQMAPATAPLIAAAPDAGLMNPLTPASTGDTIAPSALFANPTWEAWRKLIWQRE